MDGKALGQKLFVVCFPDSRRRKQATARADWQANLDGVAKMRNIATTTPPTPLNDAHHRGLLFGGWISICD